MLASARPALALPTWRSRLLGEFWIYVGLCVFFAVIAIQYAGKIRSSERSDSQSAFLRWTPTVRQLPEVNIWKQQNWPASPIMAMILQPFMEINPPFLGSQVWMLAKMAMTLASVWLVFRMLDRPETPFPLWGKALAVLLTLRPIEGDLVHGNVNLFILLTVVGCMYSYRRGWDTVAGLSLALGIACKVTPALFIPYFLWKQSWKTLAAAVVGLVLYLIVIPSFWYGWEQNLENLASWYDGMIQPYVMKYEVTSEHPNQSLPGLLERTLRHRPSSTVWDETNQVFVGTEYHNFVDLPQEVVSKISKGALLVFTIATILWMRRSKVERTDVRRGIVGFARDTLWGRDRSDSRTDWRWGAELAVITLGMLLFSERTWKHHAVTLLVPFAVLCHYVSGFRLTPATRRAGFAVLGAVAVLMLLTTSGVGKEGVHDSISRLALVYGAYTWSFILLMAAMFWIAGRPMPLAKEGPGVDADWTARLGSLKHDPDSRRRDGNDDRGNRHEEMAGTGPHVETAAGRAG